VQTDKQLFELINETYPINPNKNFVIETENNLRQMARRIKRKRIFKQISFASGGFALCVITMSWLIFFNGSDVITNQMDKKN
jgi:stage II sporulation protein P